MRTTVLLTLLALVLISCINSPATPPTPTVMIVPTTTPTVAESSDVTAEIAANYQRWQAADIRDYRFSLMVGCYCPMTAMMPFTVEVRDGNVVSVTDANGVVVATDDPDTGFVLTYATIEGIYAELMSARFSEADKLTISFDPIYSVPATVSADFIELVADDELYLGISGFTVVAQK